MIEQDLKMRREPRQQRTLEIVQKIEQTTLQLLKEGGITLLNTNVIAERSGIDISSLYRFFPNKEAIVYRLGQQWLDAIRSREQVIFEGDLGLVETWSALDDMIDVIEQEFSGYGALWQAMDVIPALHDLEAKHEALQLDNMLVLLRKHGCQWPEQELTELVRYLYRTGDVVKQGCIEQGDASGLMWRTHQKWQARLLLSAVNTQSAAEFEHALLV
ncbi:transcriptional regulator, TetR family [Pseudomonas sp. ok272]|uniref:TetR/AcrR family transcriptional regulator n=1 Tax=unclassified Pseudomonas TaxID=196821 RepID=UPI0008CBB1A7|nr:MULTISPECIES: TetR/AcrR family transcriptional regulator [unclassified Pseudomonas]SEM46346.1 transcriptional regulator, TetR family [Pseudomonas sp. ok272]SFM18039.1 transcriptional regulator, TetR family [Pseudomonas sp. ok602]